MHDDKLIPFPGSVAIYENAITKSLRPYELRLVLRGKTNFTVIRCSYVKVKENLRLLTRSSSSVVSGQIARSFVCCSITDSESFVIGVAVIPVHRQTTASLMNTS